jgi:predicted TIM-barrel enzyme
MPIVAAGCSAGIIAKSAERGGADLIVVYSTGLSRIRGHKTTTVAESNKVTLQMYDEIAAVVRDTPIIAGIEAGEHPAGRDLAEIVSDFIQVGFSGVINFPTSSRFDHNTVLQKVARVQNSDLAKEIEEHTLRDMLLDRLKRHVGLGFSREVEMIRMCREIDFFTMTYVHTPENARQMADAGADCIVGHMGGTAGGEVGFGSMSYEEAAAELQAVIRAAKEVSPSIICLGHGGPFAGPSDTVYLYQHTDAIGFVGASSIERIPVEAAVQGVVRDFKHVPLA